MGWASDAFNDSMMRAGGARILVRDTYSSSSSSSRSAKDKSKENKKKHSVSQNLYDFPTEGQVRALYFITSRLGVIFEGTTKPEARRFIKEYMDDAKSMD